MMPMLLRRKACRMEKVENLYRTATAENIFPTRPNNRDHACARPCAGTAQRAIAHRPPRGENVKC
jgi:hypothetical protein